MFTKLIFGVTHVFAAITQSCLAYIELAEAVVANLAVLWIVQWNDHFVVEPADFWRWISTDGT